MNELKALHGKNERFDYVDNSCFEELAGNNFCDECFTGRVAEDSGYCTEKGYKVIAENVASVVAKILNNPS